VTQGTTIIWRIDHSIPHTITGGTPPRNRTGEFDSGTMRQGESFEFRFDQAGEFPYYCAIHPNQMAATITVTSAN
jgi:plastocyanin